VAAAGRENQQTACHAARKYYASLGPSTQGMAQSEETRNSSSLSMALLAIYD
jgi:hypothetical protein